jgi:hypothetical protein
MWGRFHRPSRALVVALPGSMVALCLYPAALMQGDFARLNTVLGKRRCARQPTTGLALSWGEAGLRVSAAWPYRCGSGNPAFRAAPLVRQASGVRSEPISITRSAGSSAMIHRASRS